VRGLCVARDIATGNRESVVDNFEITNYALKEYIIGLLNRRTRMKIWPCYSNYLPNVNFSRNFQLISRSSNH
jgi:hypothetical protein